MGAIDKKFPWQKRVVPQVIALEPRVLFDGAAAVVATADTDPNASQTTDTNTTSTVNDPAIQNAQTEQTEGSAEVQALDSTANISSTEQLNEVVALLPGAKISLQLLPGNYPTTEALTQAQQEAERLVSEILGRADARQQLFTLFNGGQTGDVPSSEWNAAYQILIANLNNGSANPIRLEIRSAEELQEAKAAFTISGTSGEPTIYLNADWLSGYEDVGVAGADAASISKVLVEEIGHYLDATLNNGADTFGDEGEIFSRYLIDGANPLTVSLTANPEDQAILQIDGQNLQVELASFNFVNAYEMLRDLDGDGVVDNNEYWAAKEQETHTIIFGNGSYTNGLGQTKFTDGTNSQFFSGNDVSGAVSLVIGGQTYYGWISRPVKVGGVVKAFYFWTDASFTTLALAQADGNQDGAVGDPGVSDNRGFILVVDQSYFNGLTKTTGFNVPSTNSSPEAGTYTTSVVKSSSDRVDASMNDLIKTNVAPTANPDLATGTPSITASTGAGNAALEKGYSISTIAGSGNVLSNDTDTISGFKEVTLIKSDLTGNSTTASSSGVTLVGKYGTLTIKSDGSWTYTPDDNNPTVDALKSGATLQETFTYTVSDGMGGTARGLLTVQINGSNDAPKAANDYNSAKESLTDSNGAISYAGYDAIGNVLPNDADVDVGDGKSIYGATTSGTATGTTQTSSNLNSTVLSFSTVSSSIKVGYYVFYDGDQVLNNTTTGSPINLKAGNANITVVSIDYANKTVTLSGVVDNSGITLTNGTVLGFSKQQNGTANYKDAAIVGATRQTSSKINITNYTGTIAVGMTVTGGGLPVGTKVVDVGFDSNGNPTNVTINNTTAVTSAALNFNSVSLAGQAIAGKYGTLTLSGDGSYTYSPYSDNPAIDNGDVVVDTFNYDMQDSAGVVSTATLNITVYGASTNDPVMQADTATAYESGVGRSPSSPYGLTNDNTAFSGLNVSVSAAGVLSNDSNITGYSVNSYTTADGSRSANAGNNLNGTYGTLNISSTGAYTYNVDNNNSAVNALLPGQSLTETFRYKITNSSSVFSWSTLTITIQGTNDAPVAVADVGGSLTEDAVLTSTGNVLTNDTDVDASDIKTVTKVIAGSATPTADVTSGSTSSSNGTVVVGSYGNLTLGADGTYSYTLGVTPAQNDAVQALASNTQASEVFTYQVTDGYLATSTSTLTFSINGSDEPSASSVASQQAPVNNVGGSSFSNESTLTYTTAMNTALVFSGNKSLSVTDTDGNLAQVILTVEHGTLSINNYSGSASLSVSSGLSITITGTQDDINAALALLQYVPQNNYTGTDYLTIASKDSTNLWDSDSLAINIPKDYDGPTVYESNLSSGSNAAGTAETDFVTLAAPTNQTFGSTNQSGTSTYGSWTLDATTGKFTYTLLNAKTANGSSATDIVDVVSYDAAGNAITNKVTVTIVDDSPIARADAGSVTEDASPNTVSGNVITGTGSATADTASADGSTTVVGVAATNTGVDLNSSITVGADVSGSYGKINVASDGSYTYTLDNSNASVQALNAGQSLTDVFTYTIKDADGSLSHTTVTITINGANEAGPGLTITDNNSTSTGQESVAENASLSGKTFTVSAPGGLSKITVGTTDVTLSQLTAASTTPVVITTSKGVLTITGYDSSTGVVTYSYDPTGLSQSHSSGEVTDAIGISVTDTANQTTSGTLTVLITDTAPVANADTHSVASGITGTHDVISNDDFNSDGPAASKVVGVRAAGSDLTTAVISTFTNGSVNVTGTYGTLTMYADGHLSYTAIPGVTGSPTDIFVYTIQDADGSLSTSTITITVLPDSSITLSVTASHDVSEGSNAIFTVTLSGNPADTDVTLALSDGTASADDYSALTGATAYYYNGVTKVDMTIKGGKVSLPAGVTSFFVSVPTTQDSTFEGPEKFTLTASITGFSDNDFTTILDDGTGKVFNDDGTENTTAAKDDDRPSFAINDVTVNEAAGTMTFTVTKTGSTTQSATVGYSFTDGTAKTTGTGDLLDYAGTAGTLTFAANETTKTITVTINDDGVYEGAESFNVNLSNASGATISDNLGVGTIKDDGTGGNSQPGNTDPSTLDDDRPSFAINDVTVNEAAGTMTFTVTKTGSTTQSATVGYSFTDGTAKTTGTGDLLDYAGTAGTLTFAANETTKTITVTINDDGVYEGAESFNVNLSNASGATISDNLGVGTIKDDGTGGNSQPGNTDPSTLDDDRLLLVTAFGPVNEGSTYAMFEVQATPGQSLRLQLGNTTSLLDVDATITGFSLEWSSDGKT